MTSTDKLYFVVAGGPSKFDLMLSLFDGNKEPRRTVEFQLEGARAPLPVAITMVQQEDGSGESWNFDGWITNYRRNFNVHGHYSSNSRKGHINIVVPFHRRWNKYTEGYDIVVKPEDQKEVEAYVEWLRGKGPGWPVPHVNIYSPTHRG